MFFFGRRPDGAAACPHRRAAIMRQANNTPPPSHPCSATGPAQRSWAFTVMTLMAAGGQRAGLMLWVKMQYHANLVMRRSFSSADSGESSTISGGSGMPDRFTRRRMDSSVSRSGWPFASRCCLYRGSKDFRTRIGMETWKSARVFAGMLAPSPVPCARASKRSVRLLVNSMDTQMCRLPWKLKLSKLVMIFSSRVTCGAEARSPPSSCREYTPNIWISRTLASSPIAAQDGEAW
mmetsp:Transcript_62568/g.100810  ORF Transcript_62568/g.100810 Transcript_62568/m.100810 type:complete len:235 (-) Transcript_62568:5586-6290(-)